MGIQFEKNELIRIFNLISLSGLPCVELKIKIQKMIDEYCDHPEPYTLMQCGENSGIHYCDTCKYMWKEEK